MRVCSALPPYGMNAEVLLKLHTIRRGVDTEKEEMQEERDNDLNGVDTEMQQRKQGGVNTGRRQSNESRPAIDEVPARKNAGKQRT